MKADKMPKPSALREGEIRLSEDGALLKRSPKNEPQATAAVSAKLKAVAADDDDDLDLGPVHRCCQIFNVLVGGFAKEYF